MYTTIHVTAWIGSYPGVYKVEYFPPPVGGNKIKGFGDGVENQKFKKKKKKKFEDLTLLVVPKGKIQLLQLNLILFKPKICCFIAFRGKKTKVL